MDIKKALAFGLGHGGIEAILFVGIALVLTNPMLIDSQQLLMSGLERFSAIIFHLGFSVLVYQMIFKSSNKLFSLTHLIIDCIHYCKLNSKVILDVRYSLLL